MPPTEHRDPATVDIDTLPTAQVVAAIHAADATVPAAVAAAMPAIAAAVDLAVAALRRGGTVHYFGAGSSGRYATLDAAEIPPTYGLPPDRFVAHIAGGPAALVRSVEGAEDDEEAGATEAAATGPDDVVVGIAASGGTPYVRGALRSARAAGARTVLVSCDPDAPLAVHADVHVVLDTGAEVVTGSTRMKAGTATKIALHTFSTATMVRCGRTYSNLMIEVAGSNAKLRARRLRILASATGAEPDRCARVLAHADDDLKTAVVMLVAGVDAASARAAIDAAGGVARAAIAALAARP